MPEYAYKALSLGYLTFRHRPQKIHSFGCDFLGRIGERTASLAKERFKGVLRYDLEIPIFKSSETRTETVGFESLRLRQKLKSHFEAELGSARSADIAHETSTYSMKYPNVQFHINEALDQWTAKEFEVGTFEDVQRNYKAHRGELLSFATTAKKLWDEVSPAYFEVVADIFHQHHWPDGEYIGYVSIFDCNPRFLKSKTFQLYHKHKAGSNYVAAHELLHFMFYDYGMNKHADLFKYHDTEAGIFWDTAEILNSVLLHSPRFLSMLHVKEPVLYPEHEGFVKQLSAVWDKNNDIDNFIIETYTLISNERPPRRVEKMC